MTRTGPASDLEHLNREHPGWIVDHKMFLDGYRFDGRSLEDGRPRLVTETAEEMDRQIRAVEEGQWRPSTT